MQIRKLGAFAALSSFAVASFAEVPAAVTSKITEAATDGATVAAAVIVALVGIWAFKLIKKGMGGA